MKENDIAVLKHSNMFNGTDESEIKAMLSCLEAKRHEYEKGEYILRFGEDVSHIGILLSGRAEIIKEDYWGNRNIVAEVPPGRSFAESYVCAADAPLGVSVLAVKDSQVLFLSIQKILTTCSSACAFHARIIRNLVTLLAEGNLAMNDKLTYLSQRNTRQKLMSYLSAESLKRKSPDFKIPFDRQQLADYLSVDRSAMSNELSKMRREGILEYNKNHFILNQIAE